MEHKTIELEEWLKKGESLFGPNKKQWKFKCVMCGEIQTAQDFIDHGIKDPEMKVHFSCIGRWVEGRGCDWTLGGLFTLHTTTVVNSEGIKVPVFEFADVDEKPINNVLR